MTTLSRINWTAVHRLSLYLISLASWLYALFKVYLLAELYDSGLTAIGQNFTLLGLCAFFFLFTVWMAGRETNKATFAASGAILTSLMV
jgi:hypothetical protein